MGFFSHEDVVLSGQNALDIAISDLELKTTSSGTFLVSSSGANGGLASYEIGATGVLTLVDTHLFAGSQSRLDSSNISIFDIGGSPYVVTGSIAGTSLVGQRLFSDGNLGNTSGLDGFSRKSGAMSAMVEATLSGDSYVFLANRAGTELDVYRVGSGASHQAASSYSDTLESYASGVIEMAETTIAGKRFLLTLSATENGVSCFGVNASDGKLTLCGGFGANEGLGVYAPTDLEVVEAFGDSYVIVASAGSSSLSVLSLDANGALERADHILDTRHTRFGGVTSVETVKVNGQVYVIAGGADDGLTLFVLLPGGRLQYLDTIEQTNTNGLGNVQDIAATKIGTDIQVYVSSGKTQGISRFTVDLPSLGENRIGGSGAQTLTGTGNSEILFGGDGDDTLSGGFGSDYIYDGDGNDAMTGGGGGDIFVLSADGKTDRILDYQPYYDWIDLSAFSMLYSHKQVQFTQTATGAIVTYRDEVIEITRGDSKPLAFHQVFWRSFSGPDRPAWNLEVDHTGTDGDDRLLGSYLIDKMEGGKGRDYLFGDAGSDTLNGGEDDDTLNGGYSGDRLYGGNGNDLLYGEKGDDVVFGGDGNDTADLGEGDDIAFLGTGNDRANGGDGNDKIRGQTGDDRIFGDAGNDKLFGDGGDDRIKGGSGNNRIRGGQGNDTLSGADGNDAMRLDDGNDTARGGSGNDTIRGGNGHDTIFGEAGDDRLYGDNDNDRLLGGSGDDLIVGGKGDDRLIGEAGNDRLTDTGGINIASGGKGNDTILLGSGNDTARGGPGKDTLRGSGGADNLFGGGGRDTLEGGSGDDFLDGSTGDDRLNAGFGNDTVKAGDGNDRVVGNRGSDTVDLGNGNDIYVDGKAIEPKARDKVLGGDGDDRIIGKTGRDTFYGNAGSDKILGGSGGEIIKGGAGHDTLAGNKGRDTVFGESGNDRMSGGLHDDRLFGGTGNDRLEGGKGRDILSGGPGRDVFVFRKFDGSDGIRDFTNGVDKIHINISGLRFDDLKISHVSAGVKIGYGAGDITLEGVSFWKIGAEDFILG